MQEVNAVHYDEFFEPELKQLGEPLSKTLHSPSRYNNNTVFL